MIILRDKPDRGLLRIGGLVDMPPDEICNPAIQAGNSPFFARLSSRKVLPMPQESRKTR